MTYLCLDYGAQHTGLALASTNLAEPLSTLSTSDLIDHLPELISQHQIDHLVIGLPQGKHHQDVLKLQQSLQSSVNLPITLHDETLSSQEATQKLSHAKKSTRSGPDHHYAAALILQDYLDSKSSFGQNR